MTSGPSDEELMLAHGAGDAAAFDALCAPDGAWYSGTCAPSLG